MIVIYREMENKQTIWVHIYFCSINCDYSNSDYERNYSKISKFLQDQKKIFKDFY